MQYHSHDIEIKQNVIAATSTWTVKVGIIS